MDRAPWRRSPNTWKRRRGCSPTIASAKASSAPPSRRAATTYAPDSERLEANSQHHQAPRRVVSHRALVAAIAQVGRRELRRPALVERIANPRVDHRVAAEARAGRLVGRVEALAAREHGHARSPLAEVSRRVDRSVALRAPLEAQARRLIAGPLQ